jgi:DNA ligase (NAD+)
VNIRRILAESIWIGVLFLVTFIPLGSSASAIAIESADHADRIGFLRAEIKRHDELYHRRATPEITDFEYDQLKRELNALEERFPEQVVGGALSSGGSSTDDRMPGFPSYRHLERMLSLDKAHTEHELREFHKRLVRLLGHDHLVFVIEPKFDGLAVSATYERGKLVRVVTRGDGVTGDDVMINAKKIVSLPALLKPIAGREFPARIEVRGEVFISFAEFERLNQDREESGEVSYSSPRNLAAGTLKSLSHGEASSRRLEVVFYGLGGVEPTSAIPPSQQMLLAQFSEWGLPTVKNFLVAQSVDELWSAVQEMGASRRKLAYPTDGAVAKLDAVVDQSTLGISERGPRWAIAFKFTPERQTTRLRAITLQVGRTGLITPVAELEPVRIGGAMISRATLHNADEIARRDLRVGDYIVLERGGEVIPAVVGVDLTRRPTTTARYVFPTKCPGCEKLLVRRDGQVAWRCVNLNCRAQLKRRLLHFASPACVGIRGLGDATIDTLIESGRVRNVSDLYRLQRDDLRGVGRDKSIKALLAAIARSKDAELWRFVYGLGIPGIGGAGSRSLALQFGSLEALAEAHEDELRLLDGIGDEGAHNVADFFAGPDMQKLLAEWKSLGVCQSHVAKTEG